METVLLLRLACDVVKRLLSPLLSRKTRWAIATLGTIYWAKVGYDLPDEVLYSILTLGTAVILGNAHEDNGLKSNGHYRPPGPVN